MKIYFLLLLSFLSSNATAFEVKFNSFDSLNTRLLVDTSGSDTQFLTDGDVLFLNDSRRYVRVTLLRITPPGQILLQCPAGNGCESFGQGKITLSQAKDLPASVSFSRNDQEVFQPAGAKQTYGRSMEEIKRYVQTEVDTSTPAGKRINDNYNSLVQKEAMGSALSTPFYVAGVVGLVLFAIVTPSENAEDTRTTDQQGRALVLGLAGFTSLAVGYGVQSSAKATPQEVDALIESIKGNAGQTKKVGSTWNLRPQLGFGNREPSLGLSWNF